MIILYKNILILEGGFNEEHEVSLATSKEIKKALNNLEIKYKSHLVDPSNFKEKIKEYNNIDVCFNALHGPYGEDGTIQKILDDNKLKYTHSGVEASKIAFDKNLTKLKIKKTNVKYIKSMLIKKNEIKKKYFNEVFEQLGSFILKPRCSGSSFGVMIFKSQNEINYFFKNNEKNVIIYKNHNDLMIEPYIEGRELTVSVFDENNVSKAIDVTEIITKNIFFDYEAKYSKGFSKHILPAQLPNHIYNLCLKNSKEVHDIIGCKGISRSDFIYDEINDQIYFLEINTQPGLTPISLVPEQLIYNKINFDTLIFNLINSV